MPQRNSCVANNGRWLASCYVAALLLMHNGVVAGGAAAASTTSAANVLRISGITLNSVPVQHGGEVEPMPFVAPDEELRLSWHLECTLLASSDDSGREICRDYGQASYHVSLFRQATNGDADSADVAVQTASGGAKSARVLIAPSGTLKPDTRYVLQLSVVATSGSETFGTACFATALHPTDWNSSAWIGGFTSLRSEFELNQPPSSVRYASIYASGVGCFQAFLNGQLLSDSVLDPGFSTSYTHRVLYNAFAVEKQLEKYNAIGVRLGFCKYGYMDEYCKPATSPAASDASCRALNMQIRVTYKDGSAQFIATTAERGVGNCDWDGTTDHNPVTYSHIYHGEKRDDRLLQPGWDRAGFKGSTSGYDKVWQPSSAWIHSHTIGRLYLHAMPRIGPTSTLQPISKIALDPKQADEVRFLFDFGVNRAGFSRINISNGLVASGVESVVTMKHAETANADGVVNAYCGGQAPCIADDWSFNLANQTNELILRPGVREHSFTPFSAYAGFRFVEVRWLNMPNGAIFTLESVHVHTRVKPIGRLHFNSTTLNKIQDAILRTQLNNLHSLPSDCPTREKRGWLGDASVTAAEANLNFDMTLFYQNFVRSIADHNTDGAEFPHGKPALQCNPLPLQSGAASLPYNCCASVESAALPKLAYGCSGWDFGVGAPGLVGSLPSVVPENSLAGGNQQNNHPGIPPDGLHFLAWPGDPVWEIAGGMIAHETFKATGDTIVLRRGYASLKALVEFFNHKGNTQQNGLTTFGFEGDWLGVEGCYPERSRAWSLPNSTPGCLLSNMSSATAQIVAVSQLVDIADVLGESSDHAYYTTVHAKLRTAYHEAFFDPGTGSYKGNGTHVWQFANLMPLALNITPSESVSTVLSTLVASVRSGANGVCASAPCIATGFWGTRFMLQTLSRYGQHALAMQLATKTEEPSWGFMVTSNRSVGTLWEAWDGGSLETVAFTTEQDHIAFGGGIGEWLYSAAGYTRDARTGLITLRAPEPWLIGGASVSRHIVGEGMTGWSWHYTNSSTEDCDQSFGNVAGTCCKFTADVTVPLGRQVEVWLEPPPNRHLQQQQAVLVVRNETGSVVWTEYDGYAQRPTKLPIITARVEGGAVAVLTVASGTYRFSAALEPTSEHPTRSRRTDDQPSVTNLRTDY